jgi:hypothetical protein
MTPRNPTVYAKSGSARRRAVLLAAGLLVLTRAPLTGAQTPSSGSSAPAPVCAQPADLTPTHLYGLWQLTLWPLDGREDAPAATGALLFERHPEYPGSVRGTIRRSAAGNDLQAVVSGDVIDGEFNLDESADGVAMDAVWTGAPQDCGQAIQGVRRPAEGRPASEPALNFLLKKTPGWR